jgi:sugar lactone lactonase YvrE
MMLIRFTIRGLVVALLLALAIPGTAAARVQVFPDVIPLPDGWLPEGIAIGKGPTFYSGSRDDGAIYRGNLRTGEGEVFIEGEEGRVAVGLKYDRRCDILLVSGGATGQAYIYDARSGETLRVYQFSTEPSFINDVVVTKGGAFFTNSQQAALYRVDVRDCDDLPTDFEVIPLGGDWEQVEGFNANGIVADWKGRMLIVVNSTTGSLYRIDPDSGDAEVIDLGGESVSAGDGLLLRGRKTLFVVRNSENQIAEIRLNRDWSAGEVVNVITNPNFDIPTTIAGFGNALYAVNGRFTTPPEPDTPYQIVRVELN